MSAQNGQPDAYFVNQVRTSLRDKAAWFETTFQTDGTRGAPGVAGSQPFRLDRAPVVSGTAVASGPGGVPSAIVYDQPPAGTQMEIVTDTGECIFVTPPAVGSLAISYQAFRFSDQQILDALYEGLSLLWPELWTPVQIQNALIITPPIFEYQLPALFGDPYTQMLHVEYRPPSGIIKYYELSTWYMIRDVVQPKIAFTRLPPVGSVVRLTHTSPYTGLGGTPDAIKHLPVYYARARLEADQESMRVRSDDAPALRGEAANKPGTSMTVAAFWLDWFEKQLQKMSMEQPIRTVVMDRAAERLGLGPRWRAA